jgi:short-subunit dehydrogenase
LVNTESGLHPAPLRVVITGASSGIGAALACHYGRQGAKLALIGRRKEALEQLAASLPARCSVYSLDVRDETSLLAAGQDFLARHGCPDIVFANAGVSVGTLTEYAEDLAVFAEMMETNVLGIVRTFQPFIACMRERGRGALVGIASVAGYRGLPGGGGYSASKAAAIAYLESLRTEFRDTGIRVTTICPGYVATPMTQDNPYRMPFKMDPDKAAQKIAALVTRGATYAIIPWQMALVARVLHVLPNWLYDRLFARAPRKPRRGG